MTQPSIQPHNPTSRKAIILLTALSSNCKWNYSLSPDCMFEAESLLSTGETKTLSTNICTPQHNRFSKIYLRLKRYISLPKWLYSFYKAISKQCLICIINTISELVVFLVLRVWNLHYEKQTFSARQSPYSMKKKKMTQNLCCGYTHHICSV